MKLDFSRILQIVLFTLFLNFANAQYQEFQQFEEGEDTLIISAHKISGCGLFKSLGYGWLNSEELSSDSKWNKLIPPNITSPHFGFDFIDQNIWAYNNILENSVEDLPRFIRENYPEHMDTANLISSDDNRLRVITGFKDGTKIYIVDENRNQDFRDDPIRELRAYDFENANNDIVKYQYPLYDGKEIVNDSTWITIAKDSDGDPIISHAQHVVSKFSITDAEYELQVVNFLPSVRSIFYDPLIGITIDNGVKKDSLLLSERHELGEYLKLGGEYYRFDHISRDGRVITLVKESDVSEKIGLQVGFKAPSFSATSTAGKPVSLEDYKGKNLLIVNLTGCYSPKSSYEYYKELWEVAKDRFELIVIDESVGVLQNNIDELGLEGEFLISKGNRSLKSTYREDFCSRLCYLIDTDGRITKKFNILDWQKSL